MDMESDLGISLLCPTDVGKALKGFDKQRSQKKLTLSFLSFFFYRSNKKVYGVEDCAKVCEWHEVKVSKVHVHFRLSSFDPACLGCLR